MEGLIVIIIIAVAFFRVFGKFANLKEKLPADWKEQRLPPVFKDLGFPWMVPGEQVPDNSRARPVMKHRPEGGRRVARLKPKVTEPVGETEPMREPDMMWEPGPTEPVLSPTTPLVGPGDNSGKVVQLPMQDQQALLGGIIFSEVLSPPRCKRGWRRK